MLSNVTIIKSDGNLLQPPLNDDGISGFVHYGTSGIGAIQTKFFQASDALDVNITESSELYYHISEYFRFSSYPLYFQSVTSAPTDFNEIKSLKDFANGEIRILAVHNKLTAFATSQVTALQSIANSCEDEDEPLQIVYTANSTTANSALTDLKLLDSPRVSVMIGEDLSGRSAVIRTATSKSVSGIGTMLGSISKSPVHESIGFALKNNVRASEHTEVGFINGSKLSATSKTLQNTLDGYRYTFFRKFDGAGVYFNADYTCADPSKTDFSRICYNRTYDKAYRNLRSALIPYTQSNSYFDKNGKIAPYTLKFFEAICEGVLQNMKDAGEISNYSVSIDPNQNVLTTETLKIVAKIQPAGINHMIEVKLGFSRTV